MKEISLQPTEKLLRELGDRFDCVIFMGKRSDVKSKGDNHFMHFYNGPPITLKGMCEELKDTIHDDEMREIVNDDEE